MTNDVHISEAAEEEARGLSRRRFFAVSGATGAAVVAAAYLTRTPGGASTTSVGVIKAAKPSLNTDLDTAAFAASLEVLAVGTYQSALDAANAGKLGSVPPAVVTFVQTAKDQHQAHLDALNRLLTT